MTGLDLFETPPSAPPRPVPDSRRDAMHRVSTTGTAKEKEDARAAKHFIPNQISNPKYFCAAPCGYPILLCNRHIRSYGDGADFYILYTGNPIFKPNQPPVSTGSSVIFIIHNS
jgi:hypothetical protein